MGMGIALLMPQKYRATFSIDITRDTEKKVEADYEYDQFYRLEADDRFGRTIVQWFSDEAIISEIYSVSKNTKEDFKNHNFDTKFRAEKLANSYIKVNFAVSDKKEVGPLFVGVKKVLKGKTDVFNGGFNEQNRFNLVFNGPIVKESKIPFIPLFVGLVGSGFFIASFGVMLKRYLA